MTGNLTFVSKNNFVFTVKFEDFINKKSRKRRNFKECIITILTYNLTFVSKNNFVFTVIFEDFINKKMVKVIILRGDIIFNFG